MKNLAEGVSTQWKELLAAESTVDKEAGIAQQEGSAPLDSSLDTQLLIFCVKRLGSNRTVCENTRFCMWVERVANPSST